MKTTTFSTQHTFKKGRAHAQDIKHNQRRGQPIESNFSSTRKEKYIIYQELNKYTTHVPSKELEDELIRINMHSKNYNFQMKII